MKKYNKIRPRFAPKIYCFTGFSVRGFHSSRIFANWCQPIPFSEYNNPAPFPSPTMMSGAASLHSFFANVRELTEPTKWSQRCELVAGAKYGADVVSEYQFLAQTSLYKVVWPKNGFSLSQLPHSRISIFWVRSFAKPCLLAMRKRLPKFAGSCLRIEGSTARTRVAWPACTM